jgi:hypothetical protein
MLMNALAAFQGRDLVIGNVGDSRAVLGTRDKDNYLSSVQLTVDLKPNLPGLSLSLSLSLSLALNKVLLYYHI